MSWMLEALSGANGNGALLATLAGLAWKSALILSGAGLVALMLRRAAASTRHLVWAAAMVGLLFLPVLAGVLPRQTWAVLPQPEMAASPVEIGPLGWERVAASSAADPALAGATHGPREVPEFLEEDRSIEGPAVGAVGAQPAGGVAASEVTRAWPAPSTLLLLLWIAGSLAVLAPMGIGLALAQRRRAAGRVVDEPVARGLARELGIRGAFEVRRSDAITMPMVCGLLRPAVLLPGEAESWHPAKRRTVLLHELAHVLRRDCLTQFVARLALALFWFNPLAWYAVRRMRIEREQACDDLVLHAGTRAEDYAQNLLDVARHGRGAALIGTAAVMMARRSQLEGRLLAILDAGRRRTALSRAKLSCGITLALSLVAPLAMVELTAREALGIEFLGGRSVVLEDSGLDAAEALRDALSEELSTSVQALIDAAGSGDTVVVPPGEYTESLLINKPLTLQGNGWDKTRVRGTETSPAALRVEGTGFVIVRGLHLSSPGGNKKGSIGPGAIVELTNSGVRIDDCVIAGGPASGLIVRETSSLDLRKCLVTGLWGEGVIVDGSSKALLRSSDIRNVYHYGVRIAGGSDVTVEGCRISGTGWHAVRYDGASPTIRGNLLFDNDRFGIYANGKTAAKITGNHFYGNGMAGMACWKGSADTIENNTFSRNKRSALEILDVSNPKVRRNIFFESPVGVASGNLEPDSPWGAPGGEFILDENYFWRVGEEVRFGGEGPGSGSSVDHQGDAEGTFNFNSSGHNVIVDPIFLDLGALDFTIAARSAARIEGIGALDPLSFESPWPTQPEEAPFIEQRGAAAVRAAAPSSSTARSIAGPWIDDVMQIEDAALREAGVEKIRAALASGDEATRYAGLLAFLGTLEAAYDKASFRELILRCTGSAHGEIQSRAFYGLYHAGGLQPGDLERLLAVARKEAPGFSDSVAHLIFMYTGGHIEGKASEVLLQLFESKDADVLRELCRGIWGARVSPELEARLIEVARAADRSLYHDVIYFALSTLEGKSAAVIDELFRAAQDRDHNTWGRALWGLGFGVPPEHSAKVADFALKFFNARGSEKARSKAAKLIESYAGPEHADQVEALAGNELVAEAYRGRFRALAKDLRAR